MTRFSRAFVRMILKGIYFIALRAMAALIFAMLIAACDGSYTRIANCSTCAEGTAGLTAQQVPHGV